MIDMTFFTRKPTNISFPLLSSASTTRAVFVGRRRACGILIIALAWCALLTPERVQSQNVQNTQNAIDSAKRGEAHIDPTTLALQLHIPLGTYTGRGGTSLPIVLDYSSKLWRTDYWKYGLNGKGVSGESAEQFNWYRARYAENSASGWTSTLDTLLGRPCVTGECPPPEREYYDTQGHNLPGPYFQRTVARMHVTLPDGSRHELRRTDTVLEAGYNIYTGIFYSVDGARLRYDWSNHTLYMPDGARYVSEINQSGNAINSYYDRNGNKFTTANGVLTDTVGRNFTAPPLNNSSPADYTYSLPASITRRSTTSCAGATSPMCEQTRTRRLNSVATNCRGCLVPQAAGKVCSPRSTIRSAWSHLPTLCSIPSSSGR